VNGTQQICEKLNNIGCRGGGEESNKEGERIREKTFLGGSRPFLVLVDFVNKTW